MATDSKFSWKLSMGASLLYLGIFLMVTMAGGGELGWGDGMLFGFCVFGHPQTPDEDNGCWNEPMNSHIFSFLVDVILTLVVALLMCTDEKRPVDKTTLKYLAYGSIILMHGGLHLLLYQPPINCYISQDDLPSWMLTLGRVLFGAFTFFLCLIILYEGFVSNGTIGFVPVLLVSSGFAALMVLYTLMTTSEWFLPALFAVTHPLASFTGLFSSSKTFSALQGWAFLVATITGILELTTCVSFYRGIGGHLWYDLTLGGAVISGLPPFFPKENVKSIDKKK